MKEHNSIRNSIQLIKAIYGMIAELFSIDIFNEIQQTNMLSLQGLGDKSSGHPKDSHSKLSTGYKKIILVEDEIQINSNKYFNIFWI